MLDGRFTRDAAPPERGCVKDGRPIELRSDTFTLPTPAMMAAIQAAELGDDVYGEDPTVRRLEARASALLGKEAAALMSSGTMANLTAILSHCARGTKALVGRESDIYVYEAGGATVCGGVVYEPVPNQPDGRFSSADLEQAAECDPSDSQFVIPTLLCLENPQNRCGGVVLEVAYLEEVRAFAKARGLAVHLDGARLFNAAVALGVPASRLAAEADSVQFCLSKGLSAPIGAMLVGSGALIERAKRVRKMLGGGMRQAGIIAAAGLVALDQMTGRLVDDHRNARRLADGLTSLPGVVLDPPVVQTNMVFFRITGTALSQAEVVSRLWARGVRVAELGRGRLRAVTHSNISEEDVDRAVEIIAEVLGAADCRGTG